MDAYKIECRLPKGVTIRCSKLNGLGLFSTRAVKKDEVVYTGTFITVQKKDFPETIELIVEGSTYYITSDTHITPYMDGSCAVYTFDSLMNHHCEPSTHDKAHQGDPFTYDVIAARDVQEGDELTCNYNTYKWVNENPFHCNCGSSRCCDKVEGYSKLTDEQRDAIKQWTNTSAQMLKGRNV